MNDDDLYAAFEADAGRDAASPTELAADVLAEIRTRVGVRRRARFAGLAVVVTFVLIGGAVLTAGLRGTDEQSSLVVADDGSSNAGTTPGTGAGGPDEPVKVLLTGDSFAVTLAMGFTDNPETEQVTLASEARLGCGLLPQARVHAAGVSEPCEPWYEGDGLRAMQQFEPDLVLHALGPTDVVDGIADDAAPVPALSGDYMRAFSEELDRYAKAAHEVGAAFGILASPTYDAGEPDAPVGLTRAGDHRVFVLNRLAVNQSLGDGAPVDAVIEADSWLCPPDTPCVTASGAPLRPDGVHLSEEGAREAAARLSPLLVQLVGGPVEAPGTSVVAASTTWNGASGAAETITPLGPDPNDAEGSDPCSQVTTIPSCTQPAASPSVTTPVTPSPSRTVPHTPIDCGTDIPISGWPTTLITLQEGVNCLLAAFDAGNPARYRVVHFADDGADQEHVERWTLTVTGVHRVHVTVETKDYGAPESTYVLTATMPECRSLSSVHPDQRMVIVGDCS